MFPLSVKFTPVAAFNEGKKDGVVILMPHPSWKTDPGLFWWPAAEWSAQAFSLAAGPGTSIHNAPSHFGPRNVVMKQALIDQKLMAFWLGSPGGLSEHLPW